VVPSPHIRRKTSNFEGAKIMNDSVQEPEAFGLARLAKRFPVTVFLSLAFGLSYPLTSLAIMAQYGVIPGRFLPQLRGLRRSYREALDAAEDQMPARNPEPVAV